MSPVDRRQGDKFLLRDMQTALSEEWQEMDKDARTIAAAPYIHDLEARKLARLTATKHNTTSVSRDTRKTIELVQTAVSYK